jgi:hypothetical protein
LGASRLPSAGTACQSVNQGAAPTFEVLVQWRATEIFPWFRYTVNRHATRIWAELTSVGTPSSLQSTSLLLPLSLPFFPHKSSLILQLIDIGKVSSTSGHTSRVLTAQTAASPSRGFRDSSRFLLCRRGWCDRNRGGSRTSGLLSSGTVESLHRCSTDGKIGVARGSRSVVWSRVMPHYISAHDSHH